MCNLPSTEVKKITYNKLHSACLQDYDMPQSRVLRYFCFDLMPLISVSGFVFFTLKVNVTLL